MRIRLVPIDARASRLDAGLLLAPVLAAIEREIATDLAVDPPGPDASTAQISARLVDRLRARGLLAAS